MEVHRFGLKVVGMVALSAFVSSLASAAVYTGDLSYENDVNYGFYADAANANNTWRQSSILSWSVSDEESGGPAGFDWHYSYDLDVNKFVPVTWMIETQAGFSESNIDQINLLGEFVNENEWTYEIGYWEKEGDKQGDFLREMPEGRHGIFFDDVSDGGESTDGNITIEFWSNAAPKWGDLYANCGGNGNRGWNDGFTTENPTDSVSSGSIDDHLLVATPEPSTLVLLLLGSGMAFLKRRV